MEEASSVESKMGPAPGGGARDRCAGGADGRSVSSPRVRVQGRREGRRRKGVLDERDSSLDPHPEMPWQRRHWGERLWRRARPSCVFFVQCVCFVVCVPCFAVMLWGGLYVGSVGWGWSCASHAC